MVKIRFKLQIKINVNKIYEICANVPDFLYYEGELNLAVLQAFYFPSIENEIKQKIINGSIRAEQASNIFFEMLRTNLEDLGISIIDLNYNCFESNVPQNLPS